jgi:ATP-dependent helicase/DNAse subunit B
VDYKLSARKMNWARFLAGQQIQLPAYLLALQNQRLTIGGTEVDLNPVSAEYQPVEPDWKKDKAGFSALRIPKDYKREADRQRITGLLPHLFEETRRIIIELGERIFAGEIAPMPLRQMGGSGWQACRECSFRPLCRFDPAAGEAFRDVLEIKNDVLMWAIADGGQDFTGSAVPVQGSTKDGAP